MQNKSPRFAGTCSLSILGGLLPFSSVPRFAPTASAQGFVSVAPYNDNITGRKNEAELNLLKDFCLRRLTGG